LQHAEEGILPIALEAGYESHEAFTRERLRPRTSSPKSTCRWSLWRRLRLRGQTVAMLRENLCVRSG